MHTATRNYVFGGMVLLAGNNVEGWEVFNMLTGLKVGETHSNYQDAATAAKSLVRDLKGRFNYN